MRVNNYPRTKTYRIDHDIKAFVQLIYKLFLNLEPNRDA